MLDQAFEALKAYDWGVDRKVLEPINEAVLATSDDAGARKELETRLAAVLKTDVPRDAKDFVCRKLRTIGTSASVPTLAALLPEKDNSHMARYALERIPTEEAAQALRDAMSKLGGDLKIGMISSLGVREDEKSVPALASFLLRADAAIAAAAATSLGNIGTSQAVQALAKAKLTAAVTDASLACAEDLLADGKKADALAIYKKIAGQDQPKHVRLAATRGVLTCAK